MAETAEKAPATGKESAANGRKNKSPFGDKAYTGSKKGHKKPSRLLRDMRWVYEHQDDSQDQTNGRKICRKMLLTDPNKFIAQLQAMEREHRSGGSKREAAVAAKEADAAHGALGEDDGTQFVRGLIRRLLGGER